MVKSATGYSRSGVTDWLIQRLSAVVLLVYAVVLAVYVANGALDSYIAWQSVFDNLAMKIATVIAFLAFCAHAWIGLWTVATDYLKATPIRLGFHALYMLALLAMLVWLLAILFA